MSSTGGPRDGDGSDLPSDGSGIDVDFDAIPRHEPTGGTADKSAETGDGTDLDVTRVGVMGRIWAALGTGIRQFGERVAETRANQMGIVDADERNAMNWRNAPLDTLKAVANTILGRYREVAPPPPPAFEAPPSALGGLARYAMLGVHERRERSRGAWERFCDLPRGAAAAALEHFTGDVSELERFQGRLFEKYKGVTDVLSDSPDVVADYIVSQYCGAVLRYSTNMSAVRAPAGEGYLFRIDNVGDAGGESVHGDPVFNEPGLQQFERYIVRHILTNHTFEERRDGFIYAERLVEHRHNRTRVHTLAREANLKGYRFTPAEIERIVDHVCESEKASDGYGADADEGAERPREGMFKRSWNKMKGWLGFSGESKDKPASETPKPDSTEASDDNLFPEWVRRGALTTRNAALIGVGGAAALGVASATYGVQLVKEVGGVGVQSVTNFASRAGFGLANGLSYGWNKPAPEWPYQEAWPMRTAQWGWEGFKDGGKAGWNLIKPADKHSSLIGRMLRPTVGSLVGAVAAPTAALGKGLYGLASGILSPLKRPMAYVERAARPLTTLGHGVAGLATGLGQGLILDGLGMRWRGAPRPTYTYSGKQPDPNKALDGFVWPFLRDYGALSLIPAAHRALNWGPLGLVIPDTIGGRPISETSHVAVDREGRPTPLPPEAHDARRRLSAPAIAGLGVAGLGIIQAIKKNLKDKKPLLGGTLDETADLIDAFIEGMGLDKNSPALAWIPEILRLIHMRSGGDSPVGSGGAAA